MKKCLVILLILAVAGGAFAQVTFSGSVAGGIFVLIDKDNQYLYANNLNNAAARITLNGAYTNEEGTSGINFALRFQVDKAGARNTDHLQSAYAWFKPMDMLTISGGRGGAGGFATPGSIGASNDVIGGSLNLSLKLEPMDGLVVGFSVHPASVDVFGFDMNGYWDYLINDDGTGTKTEEDFITLPGDPLLKKAIYRFGVTYTMADLVKIVVNTAIQPDKNVNLAAGFDILALKDMGITKAAVDARLWNLHDFSKKGIFVLGEMFTYASGDLSATLRSHQSLPVSDAVKDLGLRIGVTGSYTMGNIIPSLGVGFGLNNTGGDDYRYWDFFGDAEKNLKKDHKSLVINPNVQFKIGGGTIDFGYAAMVNMPSVGDSIFKNAIYVNFSHSF